MKEKILELARGLYPIDAKTEVVMLDRRGASVIINGGGAKPLLMQDRLDEFWVQFVPENNAIYAARVRGRWIKNKESGYERWEG